MLTMRRVCSVFFGRNGEYEAQSGSLSPVVYVPFLTVLTLIPAPFLPETGLKPVGRSYSRCHHPFHCWVLVIHRFDTFLPVLTWFYLGLGSFLSVISARFVQF